MKASLAIYNLKGKLTWKKNQEIFPKKKKEKKYLSKRYYDRKIKELHEHKLGNLTLDS